jgi:hypothetical protein
MLRILFYRGIYFSHAYSHFITVVLETDTIKKLGTTQLIAVLTNNIQLIS